MKRFLMALSLACSICAVSVSAGEIPSGGIAPPPPPPPPDGISSTTTSPGKIPTVGLTDISDAALTVIQMMLGAGY